LHHVQWWRHGGPTDLANLLPVCQQHHGKIHDDGWTITLTADRQLTVDLPDGTRLTTGPPRRRTA
jgi:predicted restriction endonuclease